MSDLETIVRNAESVCSYAEIRLADCTVAELDDLQDRIVQLKRVLGELVPVHHGFQGIGLPAETHREDNDAYNPVLRLLKK